MHFKRNILAKYDFSPFPDDIIFNMTAAVSSSVTSFRLFL